MEAKNYDEAEFIYRRLLDDFGLYTPAIIEVKVRLGRALAASKRYDEARQILREALRLYDDHRASEYLPAGDAAEAQFVMGETYREQFDAAPLGGSREVMRERLETKASLLLAAQTHYTKAIRLGDLKWASAGGYRIGDLYESLHRAIVAVPIPPELTAAQAHLYRDELHARIRVLLTKAITVYERTLDMAERTGLGGDWVERTQTALDRLKQAYLDDLARLDHGPASPAAASQPAGDH